MRIEEISKWYDKNYHIYEKCAKEISEIIKKILEKKSIPYHSITYRIKEKVSYLEKCKKDKYKNPIEEIMDLAGIRIITYTRKDIQAVCDVVRKEFDIDKENSEDKSQKMGADQVGYLSVHYIVALSEERTKLAEYEDYAGIRSEIQIRTLLQHAWAEIEHDRNYKFSGVLPPEIKRRFYLMAGVLEMVDREFDSLSEDIDKYSSEMEQKIEKGEFEVGIDTTSLEKYVVKKFQNQKVSSCTDGTVVCDEVIEELHRFGFKTIQEIDAVLTDEMLNKLKVSARKNTYIGILRDLMMLIDIEKYFGEAYQNTWTGTDQDTVKQFEEWGIDLQKYLNKYGIGVE